MIVTRRRHDAELRVLQLRLGNAEARVAQERTRFRVCSRAWVKAQDSAAAMVRREREAAARSRTLWLRMLVAERRRRDLEIAEQRRQLGVWLHGRAAGYRADADAEPSKPKSADLTDLARRAIAHELEACARDVADLDVP